MKIRVGKRIIKTMIAVFLSISIYLILLLIDMSRGFTPPISVDETTAFCNMYTPFFAGIAAAYALHRDKKSSYTQAKIRSFGSIIGGYFGMIVVIIFEFIFIDNLKLNETNFVLYKAFEFFIVSLGIIPLILIAVGVKQQSAVFISCLTYLSVTISIRNGGMAIWLFATNRVISTLIGIGISLLVNNIGLLKNKNKDVLFVSSLDNNFLNKGNINPYTKYKLNNLYYKGMPLTFATTRTPSSLIHIFNDIEVTYPMVIMNGAAVYYFDKNEYHNINKIDDETEKYIEKELKNHNLNAFRYIIDDNMLHCYYTKLENEGEKHYYQERRNNNFDNFVRAEILDELDISLYLIIGEKKYIESFYEDLYHSKYVGNIDMISYQYQELDNNYWCLKINSIKSKKENLILEMKKASSFNKLIVCGSGKTDMELINKSDLSICIKDAPEYIKEMVDIVVSSPDEVLKIYEKIYHSRNKDKKIKKYKQKNRKE